MNYFQNFEYEIKIEIFKHVDFPLNLALTCKSWSAITKDSYGKTEWLIAHYGKAHALFQAVKLGPTFIDIQVCRSLIARKVKISKYFVQLFQELIKYQEYFICIEGHNIPLQVLGSNLPIPILKCLLEGYEGNACKEGACEEGTCKECDEVLNNIRMLENLLRISSLPYQRTNEIPTLPQREFADQLLNGSLF